MKKMSLHLLCSRDRMALAEPLINARVLLLVCFLSLSGAIEIKHFQPSVIQKGTSATVTIVPIGGQESYEVKTTLCPGKSSCDECVEGYHQCPVTSKCVNTEGGYKCVCNQGYEKGVKLSCKDRNECATGSYVCGKNSHCVNTRGSYRCVCNRCYHSRGPGRCEADCKSETRSTTYYTKVYYKTNYYTKCGGILGVFKRCKKSRKRSKRQKKTVYRIVHIPVRKGAKCPC